MSARVWRRRNTLFLAAIIIRCSTDLASSRTVLLLLPNRHSVRSIGDFILSERPYPFLQPALLLPTSLPDLKSTQPESKPLQRRQLREPVLSATTATVLRTLSLALPSADAPSSSSLKSTPTLSILLPNPRRLRRPSQHFRIPRTLFLPAAVPAAPTKRSTKRERRILGSGRVPVFPQQHQRSPDLRLRQESRSEATSATARACFVVVWRSRRRERKEAGSKSSRRGGRWLDEDWSAQVGGEHEFDRCERGGRKRGY